MFEEEIVWEWCYVHGGQASINNTNIYVFINICRRNCTHNLRVMLWSWWSGINLSTRQTLIYAHSSRNQSWPTCRHPTFFRLLTSRRSIFNFQTIRLSQIQTFRHSPLNQSVAEAEYYLCTTIHAQSQKRYFWTQAVSSTDLVDQQAHSRILLFQSTFQYTHNTHNAE